MQTLIFSNTRGTIEISQQEPYFLQNLEGISKLDVDIISQKSPQQNGSSYLNSYVQERNITFTFFVKADTKTELNNTKRTLTNLFNPNLPSVLQYSNDTQTFEIDVVVEKTPDFIQTNRGENYQVCFVSLIANNPYWRDLIDTEVTLTLSNGGLEFDLELSDEFEIETDGNKIVTINNVGDVPTPIEIVFTGPSQLSQLTNTTTGEFMLIEKPLVVGETLTVTTEKGNKTVTYDNGSTQSNAFRYIDLDSTFFELVPGTNVLTFSAGFLLGNPTITVKYKNRYLGV